MPTLLVSGLLVVTAAAPAEGATVTLRPNGDVGTMGWTVLTGTEDGTCAGGTHCDRVDETSPNTTDYVGTGTALTGTGQVEEFALTTTTGIGNATQVVVSLHASVAAINGTKADTISVALFWPGGSSNSVTVTPTTSWNTYTTTHNGNWTQAQIDGMSVRFTRHVQGTSPTAGNNDDDVRMSTGWAEVTYSRPSTFDQSGYRFFANVDAANGTDPVAVGSPLAAANTPTTAPANGTLFRLRLALHVSTIGSDAGEHAFKLQVAARGSDDACDPSFTGETYADVSPTAGVVRYANNPNALDGQDLATNAGDPTHSTDTVIAQAYEESNTFATKYVIAAGQDGLWDLALVTNDAPFETTYCLRTVEVNNAVFSAYSVFPSFTTPRPAVAQSDFRFFGNTDASSNVTFAKAAGASTTEAAYGAAPPRTEAMPS